MRLIQKYDLECTSKSKTICYSANAGLKQHCMNKQQDFGHQMLLYIIKELFKGKPTPYGPTIATKNVINYRILLKMTRRRKFFTQRGKLNDINYLISNKYSMIFTNIFF